MGVPIHAAAVRRFRRHGCTHHSIQPADGIGDDDRLPHDIPSVTLAQSCRDRGSATVMTVVDPSGMSGSSRR
jgi:hypothetical protein